MSGDHRQYVWTDGSFMSHTLHGGWAWATREGEENSGGIEKGVSSEFMELLAIMEAIESLEGPLLIFCDHQGLVKNLGRLPHDRKAWLNGNSRSPNLAPFFRACSNLMEGREIEFRWTKGHSTDPMNRQVDRMAWRARQEFESTCERCIREQHLARTTTSWRKQRQHTFGENHQEAMLSARKWRERS